MANKTDGFDALTERLGLDKYKSQDDRADNVGSILGGSTQISKEDLPKGNFKFNLVPGQDWEYIRARNQSSWGKVANNAFQFIPNVGFEVLDQVGNIFNVDNYKAALGKGESDYTNWLSSFAQKGKESIESIAPVYTNPGTADWWIDNIFGVGESVASFFVTGAGTGSVVGKGAQLLGKGLNSVQKASRVKKVADEVRGLNRAGKFVGRMEQADKALKSAAAIENIVAKVSNVGNSAMMASISGGMNGHDVYQTVYQDLVESGLDPNEAAKQASQSAAVTYNNTVLFTGLLNITSLAPLMRPFENALVGKGGLATKDIAGMISSERAAAQKAATEIGKKYRNVKLAIQNPAAARPAELRGLNRKQLQDLYKKYGKESKLAKNNLAASGGKLKSDDYLTKLKEIRDNPAKYMVAEKAWKKYGSLAFETAQESGEEYLEEIASQKGLIAGGSKDKIDWWSPEAQMAVALGAIGGVMGKGFMAAIDHRNKKYDVRDFQANINGRIEALESFKRYQEDLSDAYKSGDKRRIEYVTNERVAEMMVESVIGNSTDDIKSYAEEMLSYTKEEAEEAGLVVDPKSDAYYIRHAQKIAHVAEVAKYTFARLKNNADITSFTKPYFVKGRVKYEWAKLDADYYRGKLMEEGKKAGHTDEQIKIQINKAIANTVERYKADLSDMTGKPDSQTRALYTKSPRYASMLDKAARDLRIKEGLDELNNEQSKDKDVSAAYSESIHDYVAAELEANWMAGHVQGLAEDKYYRDEFEKHAKKEEAKVRSADRIINKAESAINTAYTGFKMTVNEDEFGISKNREKTVDVIDPNASDEDVVTETERLIRDGKNVRGAEEISGFITAQLRQFKKLKGKRKEGARERIAALVQSLDEILRNHNKSVKLSYAERIQVIDDAIEDAKENLKKGTRKDAILKALNETREDVLEELNDAVENGLEVEEEYYRYMFQKKDKFSLPSSRDNKQGKKGFNKIDEIIFSDPNFKLEGFDIDGNNWNVITSFGRAKTLVNINGVIVPFYLTSGSGGKGLKPGWYPFFGTGNDGWLNKTNKPDMEAYYKRYWGKETADIVRSVAEELNGFYGTDPAKFNNDEDPTTKTRPITSLAEKSEDYINSKINIKPSSNDKDARTVIRSNAENLGKEISSKYDSRLKNITNDKFPVVGETLTSDSGQNYVIKGFSNTNAIQAENTADGSKVTWTKETFDEYVKDNRLKYDKAPVEKEQDFSSEQFSFYERFQILGDRIASLISKHTDLSTFFGMSRRKQLEFLNEHAEELRKDIDWEPVDGLTKEWEDRAKATLDYLENEGDPVSLISLMALRGSNDFNKYLELKQENESSKRGKKKKKKKGETTEEEDQVEGQEGDEDSITYKDFKALLDQKGIDSSNILYMLYYLSESAPDAVITDISKEDLLIIRKAYEVDDEYMLDVEAGGKAVKWPKRIDDIMNGVKKKSKKKEKESQKQETKKNPEPEQKSKRERKSNVFDRILTAAAYVRKKAFTDKGRELEIYVPERNEDGSIKVKNTKFKPWLGASSSIVIGDKVRIVFEPNEYWEKEKKNHKKKDYWMHIPMAVYFGDDLIYYLQASDGVKNLNRKEVYDAIDKNGSAELIIESKVFGNQQFNNTYRFDRNNKVVTNEDGDILYDWKPVSSLREAGEKAYIFTTAGVEESATAVPRIHVSEDQESWIDKEAILAAKAFDAISDKGFFGSGMAFVALKNPLGKYSISLLKTNKIGNKIARDILNYIASAKPNFETLNQVVAINSNNSHFAGEYRDRFLQVYNSGGQIRMNYYSEKVGDVVSISKQDLINLIEGKEVVPKLLDLLPPKDESSKITRLRVSKTRRTSEKINLDDVLSFLSEKRLQIHRPNLGRPENISYSNPIDKISGSKEVRVHKNYYDYLDSGIDGDPIVETNLFSENGSVYHDVALSLRLKSSLDNESVIDRQPKQVEEENKEGDIDYNEVSDDDVPFKASDKEKYAPISREDANQWLQDRGINVSWYNKIRKVKGMGLAHGFFSNSVVNLWTNAEKGTEYHEAFHAVYRTWVSDENQNKLLDEAKQRYQRDEAQISKLRELYGDKAEEIFYEEKMADEFQDYMQGNIPERGTIRKFFDWLRKNLAEWLGNSEIEVLFDRIKQNRIDKSFVRTGIKEKVFSEKDFPREEKKQSEVKSGVEELFESIPELEEIGTAQQYSEYLDTIFPDSKVKDIVYHGTKSKEIRIIFDKETIQKTGVRLGKGFFFSRRKDYVERDVYGFKKIGSYLLNAVNPISGDPDKFLRENDFNRVPNKNKSEIKDDYLDDNGKRVYITDRNINFESDEERTKVLQQLGYDAVDFNKGEYSNEIVVFEPEQIHILGSQKDIEGFKEFTEKKSGEEEVFSFGRNKENNSKPERVYGPNRAPISGLKRSMSTYIGGEMLRHFRDNGNKRVSVSKIADKIKNSMIDQSIEFSGEPTPDDIEFAYNTLGQIATELLIGMQSMDPASQKKQLKLFNEKAVKLPSGITAAAKIKNPALGEKPVSSMIMLHALVAWENVPGSVEGEHSALGAKATAIKLLNDYGIINREEDLVIDHDEILDQVYFESSLESDPSEKISSKARKFFSSLQRGNDRLLGHPDYVPPKEAYEAIKNVCVGHTDTNGMVNAMINAGTVNERYSWMIDAAAKIRETADGGDVDLLGGIFTALRLTYVPRMITSGSKTFSADTMGKDRGLKRSWSETMKSTGGMLDPVNKSGVDEKLFKNLSNAWKGLKEIIKSKNPEDKISKIPRLMTDFTEAMGMNEISDIDFWNRMMDPESEAVININGEEYSGISLIRYMLGFESSTDFDKVLADIKNRVDPYEEYGTLMSRFANVAAPMVERFGGAYVSNKKSIYPINIPTALSDFFDLIKETEGTGNNSGGYLLSMLSRDSSYRDMNVTKMMTIPRKRNAFSYFDYDHVIVDGQKKDMNEATENEIRMIKLSWFANSSIDRISISLPTQSDRTRITGVTAPRLIDHNRKGIGFQSKEEILQDLASSDMFEYENNRLAWKNWDDEELIDGYHIDSEGRAGRALGDVSHDGVVGTLRLSNLPSIFTGDIKVMLREDENGNQKFYYEIGGKEAERKYVKEVVAERIEEYIANLSERKSKEITLPIEYLGDKTWRYETVEDFMYNYIFHDIVYRTELGKIMNGSRDLYKNFEFFVKRFGGVSTPGNKSLHFDNVNQTIKVSFIKDFSTNSTNDSLMNKVIDKIPGLSDKEKQKRKDHFKQSNKSDGMGVTSIEKYRKDMIQKGLWPEDKGYEKAYKNYMSGEKGKRVWGYKENDKWYFPALEPEKTYFHGPVAKVGSDGTTIITNMIIKHSTYPLLDEMIGQNSTLKWMSEQFNSGKVDVINTVTAAKAAVWGVTDAAKAMEDGSGLEVIELDSFWERVPQILPTKESGESNFGSQIQKIILDGIDAMIKKNVVYDLYEENNGKTKQISASSLKKKFLGARAELIKRAQKRFFDAFNMTRFKELSYKKDSMTPEEVGEFKKIRKYQLKLLRSKMLSNVGRATIDDNLEKALEIVKVNGFPFYDFNIPASLPIYERDFQNSLSSIFKKEVLKSKINGGGFVQIAEFGKTSDTKGELKHYHYDKDKLNAPEIGIPFNLAYRMIAMSGNDPQRYMDENGEFDINKIDKKLLKLVGYRIPYQELSSSIPLNIVKILPKGSGNVILVPGHITAQQGSDFDIDKLWIMMPNVKMSYKIASGFKKVQGQTEDTSSLETEYKNLDIVDFIKERFREVFAPDPNDEFAEDDLMDEQIENIAKHLETTGRPEINSFNVFANGRMEEFKEVFDAAKVEWEGITASAEVVAEKLEYNFDDDLSTMSSEQVQNLLIDSIRSILMNPNHLDQALSPIDDGELNALAKDYRDDNLDPMDFDSELKMLMYNREGKQAVGTYASNQTAQVVAQGTGLKVKEEHAIKFDGEKYTDLDQFEARNGERITKVGSKKITASVDNGKNPILSAINDTRITRPMILVAQWLGISGKKYTNSQFTVALCNHPVVLDAIKLAERRNTSLKFELYKKAGYLKKNPGEVSWKSLSEGKKDYVAVAALAYKLINLSTELKNITKVLNIDRIRPSSSHDAEALFNAIEALEKNEANKIAGYENIFEQNETLSQYRDAFMDYYRLAQSLIPSATWSKNRTAIAELIGGDNTDADTLSKITSMITMVKISKNFSTKNLFEEEEFNRLLSTGYKEEDFNVLQRAQQWQNKARKKKIDIPFLRRIRPAAEAEDMNIGLIHFEGSTNSPWEVGIIGDSFMDMIDGNIRGLNSQEKEELKQLAEDVVKAQIITRGFTPGPGSLIHYIEPAYWKRMNLQDSLGKSMYHGENLHQVARAITENLWYDDTVTKLKGVSVDGEIIRTPKQTDYATYKSEPYYWDYKSGVYRKGIKRGVPFRFVEILQSAQSIVDQMKAAGTKTEMLSLMSSKVRKVRGNFKNASQERVSVSDASIFIVTTNSKVKESSTSDLLSHLNATDSMLGGEPMSINGDPKPGNIQAISEKIIDAVNKMEQDEVVLNVGGIHILDTNVGGVKAIQEDLNTIAKGIIDNVLDKISDKIVGFVTGNNPGMDEAFAKAISSSNERKPLHVITSEKMDYTNNFGQRTKGGSEKSTRRRLGLEQRKSTMEAMDENAMYELVKKLSKRTGIEAEFISDMDEPAGRFINGKVYLNLMKMGADTPFHEFIHPFILGVEKNNPLLYKNLIKQINKPGTGKGGLSIYEELRKNKAYNNLYAKDLRHEAIVEAIGRYAAGIYNETNNGSLVSVIKRLLEKIREYISAMINKDINPTSLRADTTLREIAVLFSLGEGEIKTGLNLNTSIPESDRLAKMKSSAEVALNALKRREAYYKSRGYRAEQQRIAKEIASIESDLKEKDYANAVINFISYADGASKAIDEKLKKAIELEKSMDKEAPSVGRISLKYMSILGEQLSTLDMVGDMIDELTDQDIIDSGLSTDLDTLRSEFIAPIKERVSFMRKQYTIYAPKLAAEWLYQFNRDPNLSIYDIERLLKESDRDIHVLTRMLNSMGSVQDPILALTDLALRAQRNKIHEDNYVFHTKELFPKLRALEKYNDSAGISNKDMTKKFAFMLHTDKKGKLNGQYKTPEELMDEKVSKEQMDFAKMYHEQMSQSRERLPEYRRQNQYVASVKRETIEDLVERGLGIAAKNKLDEINKYTIEDTEYGDREVLTDQFGNEIQWVPIHYTASIGNKEKQVPPEEISYDLANSLNMFRSMSMNYEYLAGSLPKKTKGKDVRYQPGIIHELNTIRELVKQRVTKTGKIDKSTGDPIAKRAQDVQTLKMLDNYFDMQIFGKYKEKEVIEVLGKKRSLDKILDTLGRGTSFTQLGVNLTSAVNNSVIGNIHNYMSASGGGMYSVKSWAKAKKAFWFNIKDIVEDMTARHPKTKRGAMVQQFDILQEQDEFGVPLKKQHHLHRFGTGAMYVLHKTGELEIQMTHMEAQMNDHRVLDGEILSYNDWVRKGYGTSRKEFEKLTSFWDSVEFKDGIIQYSHFTNRIEVEKLMDRIKGNYERLHGNYAKIDKAGINKHAMGRLMLLFRKWMKPSWDRRFMGASFGKKIVIDPKTQLPKLDKNGNYVLEDYDSFNQKMSDNVAGTYAVGFQFMAKYFKDLKSFNLTMMKEDWNTLPQWKKALIREMMTEVLLIAGTSLLATAMSYIDLEDDDGFAEWMATFGEYQMNRVNTELIMWFVPGEGIKILRSPMASVKTAEDIYTFGSRLVTPEGWRPYESGPNAGELKVVKSFKRITPGLAQYDRITLEGLQSSLQWIK